MQNSIQFNFHKSGGGVKWYIRYSFCFCCCWWWWRVESGDIVLIDRIQLVTISFGVGLNQTKPNQIKSKTFVYVIENIV